MSATAGLYAVLGHSDSSDRPASRHALLGILSPADAAAVQCNWLLSGQLPKPVCLSSLRIASPGDGRNKEMRSVLCLLVVCLFATTAVAQFGKVGATPRNTAPPADGTPKKTNDKGHPGKAAAAGDQAGA